jgi:ATP-dependent Clp protease ATP-binding subunit ClpC
VWNVLLQVMEEGRLTDNVGRTVDFKNTILIMTTNIGSEVIKGGRVFGILPSSNEEANYEKMKNTVMEEMEKWFRPEFLNRLDDIIVFRQLSDADLKQIIDIELDKVAKRLKEKNMHIVLTEDAKETIIKKGSNKEFGARPLRRAIETLLEDPLSEEMLRGHFAGKHTIYVKVVEAGGEKKLVFDAQEGPPAAPELVGAATNGGSENKG